MAAFSDNKRKTAILIVNKFMKTDEYLHKRVHKKENAIAVRNLICSH